MIFNTALWSGDYLAAGATEIRMQLRNSGNTPLPMRVALKGSGTPSWFSSSQAFQVPADGDWHAATFSIGASDLTLVSGTASLAAVLSSVTEMRILASQSPDFRGDSIVSTLGLDDIEAKGVVDTNGDGVPDDQDAFPNDPNETVDTDHDGIGNNADTEDDGDTMPDEFELANGLDPCDAADAAADGFTNVQEFEAGTDPQQANDYPPQKNADRDIPAARGLADLPIAQAPAHRCPVGDRGQPWLVGQLWRVGTDGKTHLPERNSVDRFDIYIISAFWLFI